ncbi:acetyl-CoA carboxylase biotin carboxylase subunit [Arthrobacter sp. HY1533]|uniref:acetyl-CoA carboxylase biotin carboxylase subunit n=1 Tax=Arthrobacter sp. HY1533 TaxID=2970919 RepID=UPI0022B9F315|nr:biotin carboxylase N-terminal domain-containing protein [Arthrobacter sp. HY1533]
MRRVLVANRGEIAVRIIRACQEAGVESVAVYSEADAASRHVLLADRAVRIGPSKPAESYLRADTIVQVALATGCDAVHPGYGFLAENAAFSRMCAENGLIFIGPSPEVIDQLGDKVFGRRIATQAGIPVVPGTGDKAATYEDLVELGRTAGFPILIKAAAGGGGRGMRILNSEAEVRSNFEDAQRESLAAFGSEVIFAERFLTEIRHVEVQVLGDHGGTVVHVGTRDCSVQRRYQKVIEEGPAVSIPLESRHRIEDDAVKLVSEIGYVGAGTVEFVVDMKTGNHHFIEMNTRIQVEHPVSEMISGFDLVREQLWVADPEHRLSFTQEEVSLRGNAIELRICAENPSNGFAPSPGLITELVLPGGPGIRVDTHCVPGWKVSPYYDSMIAKLVIHDVDRPAAIRRALRALDETRIGGIHTNIMFLKSILSHPDFVANSVHTKWVEQHQDELLEPPVRTTLQPA